MSTEMKKPVVTSEIRKRLKTTGIRPTKNAGG